MIELPDGFIEKASDRKLQLAYNCLIAFVCLVIRGNWEFLVKINKNVW